MWHILEYTFKWKKKKRDVNCWKEYNSFMKCVMNGLVWHAWSVLSIDSLQPTRYLECLWTGTPPPHLKGTFWWCSLRRFLSIHNVVSRHLAVRNVRNLVRRRCHWGLLWNRIPCVLIFNYINMVATVAVALKRMWWVVMCTESLVETSTTFFSQEI